MSPDTLRLALQIIGVVIGGGILEFFRRVLFYRKAELKELDSKSTATALDSANEYIKTLQGGEKAVRLEVELLNKRLDERDAEIGRLKDLITDERRETNRIRAELGLAKSDLDVARSQVVELSRRLSTGGI